jgi:hypothetical protein
MNDEEFRKRYRLIAKTAIKVRAAERSRIRKAIDEKLNQLKIKRDLDL